MKYQNQMIEYVYKYFGETIYDAVKIEIKNATFASTQNILESGPKAANKYGERYTTTVLNLKHAYEDVLEMINNPDWKIDHKEALRINGNVTRDLNAGSGFWRIYNVRVLISRTGQEDKYMHPEIRLGKYYEEMIDAITTKNYSADDVIGLMGNMMKEQCFRDGNKRTALLFANTLLLQRNMGYIRIDNKQQYIDTILNYYEDKYNLSQFVQDVKKHFYISSKALEENKELVSQKDLNNFNDEQECLRQDKTSVNKPLKKGIKL